MDSNAARDILSSKSISRNPRAAEAVLDAQLSCDYRSNARKGGSALGIAHKVQPPVPRSQPLRREWREENPAFLTAGPPINLQIVWLQLC